MGVPGVALGLAWTQVGGKVIHFLLVVIITEIQISKQRDHLVGQQNKEQGEEMQSNPIGVQPLSSQAASVAFPTKGRVIRNSQVMVVEASKVPTHSNREGKLKLTGQVGSELEQKYSD